jgi:hypothetical protein
MDNEGFTPEQVKLVMKAAGFDTSKSLDEQLQAGTSALQKRIDDLEARIADLTEPRQQQPATPEQQRLRLAENLRDGLNKSRSPWFDARGTDGPEAA